MQIIYHAEIMTVSSVREILNYIYSLNNCNYFKQPSVFQILTVKEIINEYSVVKIT